MITATVISGVAYFIWIERLTIDKAKESLNFEAELVATQVKTRLEQIRNDVLTVSRTPPFQGIIRSARGGGVDPMDGSTSLQWRDRLETIFAAILESRPAYAQIRYIGLAQEGRELVRVDRRPSGLIVSSAEEDLQPKADRPYFRDSLSLAPGEVYFSDITLNVDFGRIEADQPMLRATTPIVDDDGDVFGFLVINAQFGHLMQSILQAVPPSPDLYIVTEAGDYVYRSADGLVGDVVLARPGGALPAPMDRAFAEDGGNLHGPRAHLFENLVVSTVRFAPDVQRSVGVGVVLSQSREALLEEVFEIRRQAIILGIAVVLAMAVPGFMISRWLTAPLLTMATGLRKGARDQLDIDLPTNRGDEVGEVARALDSLIVARRRIEAVQASTLARLQSILDNTVDAIVTVDPAGRIQSFNKGAGKIFGYRADEIVGQGIDRLLFDPSGTSTGDPTRVLRGPDGKGVVGDLREQDALTKDGRRIPVELSVSMVQTEDGTVLSCIIREIGERKRLEEALNAHAEALERSNAELEEFAYIASHDLKEPLRAISNHTQFLAEDHGDKLDEDGLRRIARLKELCVRADRLITDLLHFSRLGRDELRVDTVDLAKIVEEVRDDLVDYVAVRNAKIRILGELPSVRGDRSRLTSLIYNLVVNGLKYNDQEVPCVEIGVREGRDSDRVILFVRDNGIGIAPEFRDSVFKIFKRIHSEKAYGAGSGVGLSFARKIVERHGGRLTFDSTPGSGTIFYFDLQRTRT